MLNFLNLAHAAFLPPRAYLAASLIQATVGAVGGPSGFVGLFVVFLVLLVVVVPAVVSIVGLAMERTAFKPLYGIEDDYQLLATFGIILMMEDAMKFIWGGEPVSATAPSNLLGTFSLPGNVPVVVGVDHPHHRAGRRHALLLLRGDPPREDHARDGRGREAVGFTGIDTRSIHLKGVRHRHRTGGPRRRVYLPTASMTTGLAPRVRHSRVRGISHRRPREPQGRDRGLADHRHGPGLRLGTTCRSSNSPSSSC